VIILHSKWAATADYYCSTASADGTANRINIITVLALTSDDTQKEVLLEP